MIMNINSKYKLNNSVEIPVIGLGVFKSPTGKTTLDAVRYALQAGYRHVDTAKIYANEKDVGRAIADSEIPREEILTRILIVDQLF